MRYFRVEDEVIKLTDDNEALRYSFGEEKWVISVITDSCTEITEQEALALLDKLRTKLSSLLELAEKTAAEKHAGQFDKGGNPYFTHPQAVAAQLKNTEY